MEIIRKRFQHDAASALAVTWPEYWEIWFNTWMGQEIRQLDASTEEKLLAMKDVGNFRLPKPRSSGEAQRYARMATYKIFAKEFGEWAVIASDCGGGFRASGINFSSVAEK